MAFLAAPRLLLIVILLLLPLFLDLYWQRVICAAGIYALLALGFDFLSEYVGLVCLGGALFIGLGGYISGSLNAYLHWQPWATIPVATIAGAVVSTAVLYPCLRLRGIYFAIISFMFPLFAVSIIIATGILGSTEGISGLDTFPNFRMEQYIIISAVLVALFSLRRLVSEDIGLILRGIKDNDQAVRASGIDITVYRVKAVFIASALGCFGGAYLGHLYGWLGLSLFAMDFFHSTHRSHRYGRNWGPWPDRLSAPSFLHPCPRPSGVSGNSGWCSTVLFCLPLFSISRKGFSIIWIENITNSNDGKTCNMSTEPILYVEGISKKFGGVQAVRDVGFSLYKGDVMGIIGPNGAGKTTLVNLLTGFIKTDTGSIHFKGKRINGKSPDKIANLGLVRTFQVMRPYHSLPAYKNLIVPLNSPRVKRSSGGRYGDRDAVAIDILEEIGFERDARVPYKTAGALPLGYLKRLELARCIALQPEVILCDEIFSGMSMSEIASMIPLLEKAQNERNYHDDGGAPPP